MPLHLIQTSTGDKYFDGDWEALVKYQEDASKSLKHKINYSLDLQLYPEPFAGNPDAPVYILNGNPGIGGADRFMMLRNGWDSMILNSYNPTDASTMYWLDENWENKLFSPNDLADVHTYRAGFNWWLGNRDTSRWTYGIASELKNSCQNLQEKVFNVEYFPYHSRKLKMDLINNYINERAKDPNSVVSIVNEYLRKALKKGKVFIIMRCEEEWIDRLNNLLESPVEIKSIKSILINSKGTSRKLYDHNIITLKNPQRTWLTAGNILEDTSNTNARWCLICSKLGCILKSEKNLPIF